MSTWSLSGVDITADLAVTSCSRWVLVGLGVQSKSCTMVSALQTGLANAGPPIDSVTVFLEKSKF